MPYKDKDKQREADRTRQKRRRDKIRAKGVTDEGVTSQGVTKPGVRAGSATSEYAADIKQCRPSVATVQAITDQAFQDKAAQLPASVPEPVRSRYARGEPEYMATIDRLLAHTLDELKAQGVWIPVWRYTQG